MARLSAEYNVQAFFSAVFMFLKYYCWSIKSTKSFGFNVAIVFEKNQTKNSPNNYVLIVTIFVYVDAKNKISRINLYIHTSQELCHWLENG